MPSSILAGEAFTLAQLATALNLNMVHRRERLEDLIVGGER